MLWRREDKTMLRMTTAGESHGPALLAILEGIPAGLALSEEDLIPDLERRQTGGRTGHAYKGASPRMQIERDRARILAGVMAGKTTGAPIALMMENADHVKWQGKAIEAMTTPRPGHADAAAAWKYGYDDFRIGLERASARETAVRVAAGAICRKLLAELQMEVGSYVVQIGPEMVGMLDGIPLAERLRLAELSSLRCPDAQAETRMQAAIEQAMRDGETLGGKFELVGLRVPPGLGSHVQWDRKLSSRLGAALFGIQAVKAVEIGDGAAVAALLGTHAQDPFRLEAGTIKRDSNHAGGIEAGISNGEPILARVSMKPIATTIKKQASVDFATGEPAETNYERSDFCPVPRAAIVGEAMMCFVLADALMEACGGDSLDRLRSRFNALPKGMLSDFKISPEPKIFWP
jgi:chorismate synthase